MDPRQEREQGQRRARLIRLALAGGGVVVTVAVAGVVQATTGVAATTTDQAPTGSVPDSGSGSSQFPSGTDPGATSGFLAPGDAAGGQDPHGSSHGS